MKEEHVDIPVPIMIEDDDIIVVRIQNAPDGAVILEDNGSVLVDLKLDSGGG